MHSTNLNIPHWYLQRNINFRKKSHKRENNMFYPHLSQFAKWFTIQEIWAQVLIKDYLFFIKKEKQNKELKSRIDLIVFVYFASSGLPFTFSIIAIFVSLLHFASQTLFNISWNIYFNCYFSILSLLVSSMRSRWHTYWSTY